MYKSIIGAAFAALATFGVANADDQGAYGPPAPWHGCSETPHPDGSPCACEQERVFYQPGLAWAVNHSGGPGVHVYSRPVDVPSGRIDIQGPPIYVEAPPIRVAPVQIYLHAPDVRVRPSTVTVAPPIVNYTGCEDGRACTAQGGRP